MAVVPPIGNQNSRRKSSGTGCNKLMSSAATAKMPERDRRIRHGCSKSERSPRGVKVTVQTSAAWDPAGSYTRFLTRSGEKQTIVNAMAEGDARTRIGRTVWPLQTCSPGIICSDDLERRSRGSIQAKLIGRATNRSFRKESQRHSKYCKYLCKRIKRRKKIGKGSVSMKFLE